MHIMKTVESMSVDKGNSTAEIKEVQGLLFIVDLNQISKKFQQCYQKSSELEKQMLKYASKY